MIYNIYIQHACIDIYVAHIYVRSCRSVFRRVNLGVNPAAPYHPIVDDCASFVTCYSFC